MRLLRQLRQLRQIVTGYSNRCASHLTVCPEADLGGLWAVEPVPQLTFTKSPLPADFDSGDFFTFRPKTKRASCNPQPFGDGGGGQKRFRVG